MIATRAGARAPDRRGWCCARPPRRARSATPALGRDRAGRPRLRPATAPGEDRNIKLRDAFNFVRDGCARPPRRVRIATIPTGSRRAHPRISLRPATAPGEDRNVVSAMPASYVVV